MGAYKGPASTIKDAEKTSQDPAYKKGGKAHKKGGACMSSAARPARKSGGGVFSSAKAGTPRGKASHY